MSKIAPKATGKCPIAVLSFEAQKPDNLSMKTKEETLIALGISPEEALIITQRNSTADALTLYVRYVETAYEDRKGHVDEVES